MRALRMLTIGLVAAWMAGAAAAHATEPPADKATVVRVAEARSLPSGITTGQRAQLNDIVARLRSGDQRGAADRWAAFCSGYFTASNRGRLPQLQEWLLREGVLEAVPALALSADKVRFFNEQKREVQNELLALREARSANPTPHPVSHAVLTAVFTKGAPAVASRVQRTLTVAQIDTAIKELEATLQTVGDDAQLANVDLQNAIQKQQQTLQMLSTISKLLSDTSMAIIRKIGG